MFHQTHYICILIIFIEFSASEIVTLHGADNEIYTYDNSFFIGEGRFAKVFEGL